MPQSFKPVEFDYTDENQWRNYFRIQVQNFAEKAKALYEFRQELIQKCDGIPFNELQEQWDYSQVLLGGVNENGEYQERSLANVYKELFGLRIKNVAEVIEKQRQGVTPSTQVVVENTAFVTFVSDALELAETVLQKVHKENIIRDRDIEAEYDFYELLSDQQNLSQLLSDFLRQVQEILPNYNEKAVFIWTLDKNINRYLSVAYPKIKDRDSWGWLEDTFGIKPEYTPNFEETGDAVEDRKRQYTVYTYQNNSLGDTLVQLYQHIWEGFDADVHKSLRLVFPEVPNFKQEFLNKSHDKLNQVGVNTTDRNRLDLTGTDIRLNLVGEDQNYSGTRGNTTEAEYHISGVTVDSYSYAGFSTSNNFSSKSNECNHSVLQILDGLAPLLFLLNGLEYELHIDQHSLAVKKL